MTNLKKFFAKELEEEIAQVKAKYDAEKEELIAQHKKELAALERERINTGNGSFEIIRNEMHDMLVLTTKVNADMFRGMSDATLENAVADILSRQYKKMLSFLKERGYGAPPYLSVNKTHKYPKY